MKHLLDFQNIQKKEMENLIEEILKVDLHKLNQIKSLTLLQFNENSTRTRLSFAIAAKRLGIDVVESTDNISAKSKGEGLMHELETYQSMGIEPVVIRSSENNIDDYKNFKEVAIISGGFGNSSHPTQALVDLFTIRQELGTVNNLNIAIVGDLLQSVEGFDEHILNTELNNPLNLEPLMDRKLDTLSGGELQRVAVAECLLREADLYLLDEPSAYLDANQRMITAKTIRRSMEQRGKSA